jgi:DNA-binding transcriptional regulator YiaG
VLFAREVGRYPGEVNARQLADVARIRRDLASGAARQARKAAGVQQSEVAGVLGVSAASVSQWESGKRVPGTEHALAYAKLLGKLAA